MRLTVFHCKCEHCRLFCCCFQDSDDISFEAYARIQHVLTGFWLHALAGIVQLVSSSIITWCVSLTSCLCYICRLTQPNKYTVQYSPHKKVFQLEGQLKNLTLCQVQKSWNLSGQVSGAHCSAWKFEFRWFSQTNTQCNIHFTRKCFSWKARWKISLCAKSRNLSGQVSGARCIAWKFELSWFSKSCVLFIPEFSLCVGQQDKIWVHTVCQYLGKMRCLFPGIFSPTSSKFVNLTIMVKR